MKKRIFLINVHPLGICILVPETTLEAAVSRALANVKETDPNVDVNTLIFTPFIPKTDEERAMVEQIEKIMIEVFPDEGSDGVAQQEETTL